MLTASLAAAQADSGVEGARQAGRPRPGRRRARSQGSSQAGTSTRSTAECDAGNATKIALDAPHEIAGHDRRAEAEAPEEGLHRRPTPRRSSTPRSTTSHEGEITLRFPVKGVTGGAVKGIARRSPRATRTVCLPAGQGAVHGGGRGADAGDPLRGKPSRAGAEAARDSRRRVAAAQGRRRTRSASASPAERSRSQVVEISYPGSDHVGRVRRACRRRDRPRATTSTASTNAGTGRADLVRVPEDRIAAVVLSARTARSRPTPPPKHRKAKRSSRTTSTSRGASTFDVPVRATARRRDAATPGDDVRSRSGSRSTTRRARWSTA